jgi:protein FAM50
MSSGGGSYTQEGNAAGSFAAKLEQQRDTRHAEFERKKAAIEAVTRKTLVSDDKFTTSSEQPQLAAKTVGLVTIDDFRRAREDAEKQAAVGLREEIHAATAAAALPVPAVPAAGAGGQPAAKRKRALLSFSAGSDDEDGDAGLESSALAATKPAASGAGSAGSSASGTLGTVPSSDAAAAASSATSSGAAAAKRPRFGKDPSVETGFLPDAEREAAAAALSEQLRGEWTVQQDRIKKEKIEVVYSWWDGTGHRRQIVVPKGATVGKFLEWVRQDLMAEFPALRGVSADSLLYVKEDLIMPHGVSFYDLIVNRVRGKSGPLFQFDVKHDVRLVLDSRVEKDESHPGKVVERRWYEKNKHQFPASRWELFDWASVKKYETAGYTTHGQEVHGKRA